MGLWAKIRALDKKLSPLSEEEFDKYKEKAVTALLNVATHQVADSELNPGELEPKKEIKIGDTMTSTKKPRRKYPKKKGSKKGKKRSVGKKKLKMKAQRKTNLPKKMVKKGKGKNMWI